MPELPECDSCLFCAAHHAVVCAVHPAGPVGGSCPDFQPDPELKGKRFVNFLGLLEGTPVENPYTLDLEAEQWESEGATYYKGELILQPQQRWTREEQMELLDTHPMFTGRCPQCEMPFPRYGTPHVHWDCPHCGWKDDSV